MITIDQAKELRYYTTPRDQGQIVEVSYACDFERGLLVSRGHDRSDQSTSYSAAELDESVESQFEPWNGILPKTTGIWSPVS